MSKFYDKIVELEKAFTLDYMTQSLEIGSKTFVFGPPTTPAEERQQRRWRKQAIGLLIKDAAKTMAEEAMIDYYEPQASIDRDYEAIVFTTINAILKNIPTREQVQSPIDNKSYQDIKIDTDKKKQIGLNYDAYQVKMQDPKLEFEDDAD